MGQSVTLQRRLVSVYGVRKFMEPLRRLGDRLDVIETALVIALQESEPEHRGRMLGALDLATAAVRAEHEEVETITEKRSSFRLICGSGPISVHRRERATPTDDVPTGQWQGRTPDHAVRSAG